MDTRQQRGSRRTGGFSSKRTRYILFNTVWFQMKTLAEVTAALYAQPASPWTFKTLSVSHGIIKTCTTSRFLCIWSHISARLSAALLLVCVSSGGSQAVRISWKVIVPQASSQSSSGMGTVALREPLFVLSRGARCLCKLQGHVQLMTGFNSVYCVTDSGFQCEGIYWINKC